MDWIYEVHRDQYIIPHCERSLEPRKNPDFKPPSMCNVHLHHNIELLYVIEGIMRLELMDVEKTKCVIILKKNNCILINCNIIHHTTMLGRVEYYCTFIPPQTLAAPLCLEIGKTYKKPYYDYDQTIAILLENMYKHSLKYKGDAVESTLITSLSNSIMSIILPKMKNDTFEMRASAIKSDILTYVYKNFRNSELSPEAIAKNFGYSQKYLQNIFNKNVGMGIHSYINQLRINEAKSMLQNTTQSIESISYSVGFESVRSFFRVFKQKTGMTPGEWRRLNRS